MAPGRLPAPRTDPGGVNRISMSRLIHNTVYPTFHALVDQVGLQQESTSRRPRIHDLRHAFAVRTLLRWYRDGGDVQARLPLLSTYLGHINPASTYWYYSDSRVIPMSAPSRA